jgi:hypothetical protein
LQGLYLQQIFGWSLKCKKIVYVWATFSIVEVMC